ncbi:hypothetical protein VHEMI03853 [[Torrubiella] hemipterigena]|uniref:Uncharacterized protein n=1 Tax=[Torrubiella] hemipterigena TaxID=1531966 RepID=A0A0A1TC41_9HYPO|nr:hypothetical protein VHEMI03853 [[Torrubiella] hemipterigena]
MLRDRIEDADDSDDESLKLTLSRSLTGSGGLLATFKKLAEDIIAKLAPQDRLRRLSKHFIWPFEKKDITEMFDALERLKTHIGLLLQNDVLMLAKVANLKLDDIGDKIDHSDDRLRDKETQEIINWVSLLSFHAAHNAIFDSVQPGTGTWFLNHETYCKWLNGDIDMLWCPGIPGAGKTRRVSIALDTFRRDNIVSIYCEYNRHEEQTTTALLSNILQQLLQESTGDTMLAEVGSLYELHKRYGTRPTITQISDLLCMFIAKLQSVHIFVDALDECSESEATALQFISASDDLRTFADAQIQRYHRLAKHVSSDSALKDLVINTVITKSQGMFLLAKLHLESLSKQISCRGVKTALQALPSTLDAMYDEAIHRISSQDVESSVLAKSVLFWIASVRRPLTIQELQHLYAIGEIAEDEDLEQDDLPDGDILTAVCGGLITVDGDAQTVHLIHYSAREYFDRVCQPEILTAKEVTTLACLKYLMLPAFASGICLKDAEMEERLQKYALLGYAAKHWGAEAMNLQSLSNDILSAMQLFVNNPIAISVTSQAWGISLARHQYWRQEFPRDVPALVLTAAFFLPSLLEDMIKASHPIEGRGSDGETALIRAARFGHTANVRTLLALGADANTKDYMGETALDKAA